MKEFKGTIGKWNVSKVPEYNDVLKSEMIVKMLCDVAEKNTH